MIQRFIRVLLCAATVLLASCGGGDSGGSSSPTAQAAAAALRAGRSEAAAPLRAMADPNTEDAANQLLDFAETYFPQYFPSHAATAAAYGYFYRYYPATGIYLGVREGQVYVMGGSFGANAVPVGALAQFITLRPLVLSSMCASMGAQWGTFATPAPVQGKNAGLTVAGCTGALRSLQWVQTAGPAVSLLADKTQTLSFEPTQAGSYGFRVSFVDSMGFNRVENIALNVDAATASAAAVTARASHSVRMGGTVSLRAWPTVPAGDGVRAVTWRQIEGPAVELQTSSSGVAFFTAPEVGRDTLVRLRATLYTNQGRTDSDEVMVLVERHAQASPTDANAVWAGDHVSRVYPYVSDGLYRNILAGCVYSAGLMHSGSSYNLCTLGSLPLLAQETGGNLPTVEQVMRRVLVSHDWLGRNFENFLRTQDTQGDIRRMLNSVVAIVLSTEVRPSFYYSATGAIYLDADSFWLTPEERDLVNESPDYRSGFGNGLQYDTLWRYVQNGRSIFNYWDPEARVTRTMADVGNEAAWQMYHELGHALDFIPPSAYLNLRNTLGVWGNISGRYEEYLLTSDTVSAAYPLRSTVLAGLGQVRFWGATATALQKSYTASTIASEFSADLATDDYAYSTQFEDVAMTLEEMLMQRRRGVRREFAITDAIDFDTASASTIIVRWGQRGRVGDSALKPRVTKIAQALVPWLAAGEVDLLPAPIRLRAGESWADVLQDTSIPRKARAPGEKPTLMEMWQFQRELKRMQHHRERAAKRLPPALAPRIPQRAALTQPGG